MIFLRQWGPLARDGKKPGPEREKVAVKTYEEMMDEITRWNIEHTDILEILRGQIQECEFDIVVQRITYWDKKHM
jgi:hypothetical protein